MSTRTLIGNIKGPKGDTGAKGEKGDTGTAATITVGTVSTTAYGNPAKVTNAGTSSAAKFNFVIPEGAPGATTTEMDDLALNTITSSSAQYPQITIGDTANVIFGKIKKFLQDLVEKLATKVNYTDSLTMEEIEASSDLTNKVASAEAAETLKESVTSLEPLRPQQKHLIIMGDSYSIDDEWTGWINQFKSITGFDVVAESGVGGSGFIGAPDIPTVFQQLNALAVTDPDIITDIVILGGYNDASARYHYGATEANFKTVIDSFSSYAKGRFKNAKIHYGFIGIDEHNNGFQQELNKTCLILERRCGEAGIAFIPNAQYVLLNHDFILQTATNTNAKSHPNSAGTMEVARFLDNYLSGHYVDIKRGINHAGINFYFKNGEVSAFPHTYAFATILPAMTYPFNTWTTIADLTNNPSNFLWGTHDETTCFKFWAAVYTGNGTFLTHALFRFYDKKIQVNPLNSTSGMVLTGNSWICVEGFHAPFESMFG